nr:hypothetical protein [Clostridia bacterium]
MSFITLLVTVFVMSSVTALMIMLAKQLMKNSASPAFHYYIWLILIVRLVFPILPQSDISVHNLFTEHIRLPQITISESADEVNEAQISPINAAEGEKAAPDTEADNASVRFRHSAYAADEIEIAEKGSRLMYFPFDTAALVVYLTVTAALLTALSVEYFNHRRLFYESSIPCGIA